GQKRYTTEIIADQVCLLGAHHPLADSAIQSGASGAGASIQNSAPSAPLAEQDIPSPEATYASEIKVEDLPF
ncbi:hypothetical protein HZA45_01995, partial [Candidatus Peregrinibacteria bacterium]|nr:hypothetical protein [Candidatus Peregrinibacteria bacterium]